MSDVVDPARAAGEALRRRDLGAARKLFAQALEARPTDAEALYGLARASAGLGDDAGELDALDRLLAVQPGHLPGLMMKADHLAKRGEGRAASAFYSAAVARGAALSNLAPEIRAELRRAERQIAMLAKTYQDHLVEAVAAAGFDPARSSPRFIEALDLLFGRKQIYLQSPTSFYFPGLPQRQFYERSEFPWLAALEAKTEIIRDELLGLVGDESLLRPYVKSDASRPPQQFGGLLDKLDWSAFFLIEYGTVTEGARTRCPRTLEALEGAPLCRSPGRTPAVLFSLLRPGTRIPPHTGYTNARLICHLPLIVPEGCALRVGNETRAWVSGQALVFDDSMEHEAWNLSGELRAVLLFDIWRPELTEEERGLVAATLAAVGSYDGGPD